MTVSADIGIKVNVGIYLFKVCCKNTKTRMKIIQS